MDGGGRGLDAPPQAPQPEIVQGAGMLQPLKSLPLPGGLRSYFVLVATAMATSGAYLVAVEDVTARIAFVALVVALLALCAWLVAEVNASEKPARIAIASAAAITLVYFGAGNLPEQLIALALGALGIPPQKQPQPDLVATLGLAMVWIAAITISVLTYDRSAMTKVSSPLADAFPEPTFQQQFLVLIGQLRAHLDQTDAETNWSHTHFVPLEAEVEVIREGVRSTKISDLYAGIRKNADSQLFLVLGQPGTGKSVALRKLARDLLNEALKTGRLPLYINLKEWRPAIPWTRASPPTSRQLTEFLIASVKRRIPYHSFAFIDEFFVRLIQAGRVFLILDSFDEIPSVLDAQEAGWLIQELSVVLTQVATGAPEARGLVASRHFRSPLIKRSRWTRLDLRPLSEVRIAQLIDLQASRYATKLKAAVLSGNSQLASMASNPFTLGLLISYAERHAGQLPRAQVDLFDDFIRRCIAAAGDDLVELGIDEKAVLAGAESIAQKMFERSGLDATITDLKQISTASGLEGVVDFLVRARLGRVSVGQRAFSFVHRRFNEFFLVQTFRRDPLSAPLEAIAADDKWRDAMVLYGEIAEEQNAHRIAAFCHDELTYLIGDHPEPADPRYLRGLHAMRYLSEAFRGRTYLLEHFGATLADGIVTKISESGKDLLFAKHAIESVIVLPSNKADEVLYESLASNVDWLSETAFRSARFLKKPSTRTLDNIKFYFLGIPDREFIARRRHFVLLFSLSETYAPLKWIGVARSADIILNFLAPIVAALLVPPLFLGMALALAIVGILMSFFMGMPRRRRRIFFPLPIWPRSLHPFELMTSFRQALLALAVAAPLATVFTQAIAWMDFAPQAQSGTLTDTPLLSWALVGLCSLPLSEMVGAKVKFELRSAGLIAAGGGASIAFTIGIAFLFDRYPELMDLGAMLFAGLTGLLMIVLVWVNARRRYRDWRRLNHIKKKSLISSRREIAAWFRSFETSWGRHNFVKWLQELTIQFDMRAQGSWPDARRPNSHSDFASELLARLDERWLGLAK